MNKETIKEADDVDLSECKLCEEPTPESELSDYGLCLKCEQKAKAMDV